MDAFAGAYGDKRRAAAMARLHEAMVERRTVVVRELGGDRRGEVSAHGVLASPRVTAPETIARLARRTGEAAVGRRVVVAQDTTEVSFPGRASRGLGPAGRLGTAPGFFVHAAVAVDAGTEAVLGWRRPRSGRVTPAAAGRVQAPHSPAEDPGWPAPVSPASPPPC